MILSISPKTSHGTPSFIELVAPSIKVPMRSATGEIKEAFLGNAGITDELPQGFSVKQSALQKSPWIFGKPLFLEVYSYMLQAKNGDSYNLQVESNKCLVLRAVRSEEDYFGFIVVVPSDDSKFSFKPVLQSL